MLETCLFKIGCAEKYAKCRKIIGLKLSKFKEMCFSEGQPDIKELCGRSNNQ